MPTFHFACLGCKAEFDMKLPFGSKDMPACPTCLKKDVQKIIKPPVISFKGTGFYKTDSRQHPTGTKNTSPAADAATKPASAPTPPSPTKNA
jgi:putative FmdB family regulatory protein